jgi:hypothetical protein
MNRTPSHRNFEVPEVTAPEAAPQIPKAAYDGIEACRKSGDCNMFEFNRVMRWCYDNDEFAAVVWMDENPSGYATGVWNNAWAVISPTGVEKVDFSESETLDGLPQEMLDMMSEGVNEANEHEITVVGKDETPRSFD